MSDLRDLYQELILDHNRKPRNFGPLAEANRSAKGVNPLCGDKVTVHLVVEDDRVKDVRFEGTGCAISIASASVMPETLKQQPRSAAMARATETLPTSAGCSSRASNRARRRAFSCPQHNHLTQPLQHI